MEMDFRLEAAAASEFAENTAQDKDFRIPRIDWDRTTKEVLKYDCVRTSRYGRQVIHFIM